MVTVSRQTILSIAMCGACSCLAASPAWAGDALTRVIQAEAAHATAGSRGAPGHLPVAHLDLAPPAANTMREISNADTESFPSGNRPKMMSPRTELPVAFSAVSEEPRPESKAEQLAKNFRREGLPVAKLFQSNEALVHIGLSPKGKPGLWLIKKLH